MTEGSACVDRGLPWGQGKAELWIAWGESFDPAHVSRLKALATPNVRFWAG